MNQPEFEAIKATFPWTERVIPTARNGGLVQVIDRNGNEVPLFAMTRFLSMITNKLAAKSDQETAT
jgi:hypothetical protein